MSHFTVLVKMNPEMIESYGSPEAALAEMMAPYQENNMDDCPKDFLEFNDETDDLQEKWENETIERIKTPDGALKSPHDRIFEQPVDPEKPFSRTERVYPAGYQRVDVPVKESFASFAEYVEEYHGYRPKTEGSDRYGWWENPKAKWDWYQVGGRWAGSLKIKKDAHSGSRGELSWTWEHSDAKPYEDASQVDICRVKDIDLEALDAQALAQCEEAWALVEKLIRFEKGEKFDQETERELRHPFGIRDTLVNHGFAKWEDKKFVWLKEPTHEDWLKHKHIYDFGTYSVLDDEGWHEQGSMGWFGMSSETPEEANAWKKGFIDHFIRDEDSETILAVVDCHI